MQAPISSTLLTKGVCDQGTWFHSVEFDGYMTLYVTHKADADLQNAEVVGNDKITLFVGHRDQPVEFRIDECLVKNYPVYKGEECWATTSNANRYYVHGFVCARPVV